MTVITDPKFENTVEAMRKELRSLAAKKDIDALAQLPKEQLQRQRDEAAERVELRSNRTLDENRDATDRENQLSKADLAEIEALDAALVLNERQAEQYQTRASQIGEAIDWARGRETDGHSPLLVSPDHLRSHAVAIRSGLTYGAVEELEMRAKVTVATDTGSPGSWGSGEIPDPVTLRRFAGIPVGKLEGATAQMPSLTLPAGAAGVVESNAHGEYDAVDVANLTTLRYGRWSDVTSFVDEFTTLTAINQAHGVGIARDLNLVDLTAIQTAAGSVTAFSASLLDQNVRAAILKVAAAALGTPDEVILFGTSTALAIVNGYAPSNADDRGSSTTRVFGARTYVTEQATAGNVYAFHPRAFKVFAGRLASASVIDPTTGGHKFGSWIHSTGPGVAIVGGAAGVDVTA